MKIAARLALLAAAGGQAALLSRPFAEVGAWIVSSGGFVSDALAIEETGAGGGRGLCVSRAVAAGEPLLAVPRCCTLHACAGGGLKAHEALMLRLLEEEARGATSEFCGYLATLPSHIRLLRDWPEPELHRMPADLVARVKAHQRSVDATVDRVRRAAARRAGQAGGESGRLRAEPGGARGGAPATLTSGGGPGRQTRPADATRGGTSAAAMAATCAEPAAAASAFLDRCLWAESVVRSRSLAFTADDGSRALALVPIFDLANHQRVGEEAVLREERGAREGGVSVREEGVSARQGAVNAARAPAIRDSSEVSSAPETAEEVPAPPVLVTADGFTVLCARTSLCPGEAVLIEYSGGGQGGAAGLLLDYGFVEPPGADLTLWGALEEAADRARRAAWRLAQAEEEAGQSGEGAGAAARESVRPARADAALALTDLLCHLRRSILEDDISVGAARPSLRVAGTNVTCLRPAAVGTGGRLYDDGLRSLPVQKGRLCTGVVYGGCADCCSRVTMAGLASASECKRLLSLARPWLPPAGPHPFNLYLKSSGASGDLPLHLGMMRLVERCRRAMAAEYGLPLRLLTPRQAFLSRITEETQLEEYTQVRGMWLAPIQPRPYLSPSLSPPRVALASLPTLSLSPLSTPHLPPPSPLSPSSHPPPSPHSHSAPLSLFQSKCSHMARGGGPKE